MSRVEFDKRIFRMSPYFAPLCRMSNLRNPHVALSIFMVKGLYPGQEAGLHGRMGRRVVLRPGEVRGECGGGGGGGW